MKKKCPQYLNQVLPSSLVEVGLFLFCFLVYAALGVYIAYHYRIIFDDRIPWDAYFSFDNRAIVMTGGGYERHPLSKYWFDTLRELALFLSSGKKDEIFRTLLALMSATAMGLGIVQVYKYLRNIIDLGWGVSLLLSLFFACFATTILLSFTPETYTYTLLFLMIFSYYAAKKIKDNKVVSFKALILGSIFIGGLTITNWVKVYIPILFERDIFKNSKKLYNALVRVLVSAIIFITLVLYRIDFKLMALLDKSVQQYEKFSQPKLVPIWDMVVSWFFGGNILFSSFFLRDYHTPKSFYYKALFMDTYTACASYIFIGIIWGLVFLSYIKNFKNPLVQILMLSFFIDVLIHVVLKFGLHTAYIYGGHFIFVVPLMLGWLYHAYHYSPRGRAVLVVLYSLLFVFLIFNNSYRIEEFLEFLNLYYR